jgi:hypothetical protein
VDEQGSFELDSMIFGGKSKLYYAYLHKFEKQRDIHLEVLPAHPHDLALAQPLPTDELVHRAFAPGNSEDLAERIEQLKYHEEEIKVLERVTVRAKRTKRPIEELEQRYATGVFLLPAKVTLDNVNDPSRDGSMTVIDYIRNRINEVELTGRGFVNRKTMSMETQTRWLVGLFLDEAMTELPMLRSIRMEEVAMVKFFDMGWVGVGSTYPGGALAIYTKKHEERAPPPPKLPSINAWGYTLAKTFLEIDYGQKDVKHAAHDRRPTLYWNPGVYLTKKTPAFEWNFYTNDIARPVKIIVEGVDREGRFFFEEVVL